MSIRPVCRCCAKDAAAHRWAARRRRRWSAGSTATVAWHPDGGGRCPPSTGVWSEWKKPLALNRRSSSGALAARLVWIRHRRGTGHRWSDAACAGPWGRAPAALVGPRRCEPRRSAPSVAARSYRGRVSSPRLGGRGHPASLRHSRHRQRLAAPCRPGRADRRVAGADAPGWCPERKPVVGAVIDTKARGGAGT